MWALRPPCHAVKPVSEEAAQLSDKISSQFLDMNHTLLDQREVHLVSIESVWQNFCAVQILVPFRDPISVITRIVKLLWWWWAWLLSSWTQATDQLLKPSIKCYNGIFICRLYLLSRSLLREMSITLNRKLGNDVIHDLCNIASRSLFNLFCIVNVYIAHICAVNIHPIVMDVSGFGKPWTLTLWSLWEAELKIVNRTIWSTK